jgi:hypothetical protein
MNRITLCLFAILIMGVAPIAAEQEQQDWQPDPPPAMPEQWDWMQTTSLEWFKGKLLDLYEEKLNFDSKELDELSFDWSDVKEIRTKGTMVVGLTGGRTAVGRVFLDGDTIRVLGDEDQSFAKGDVLSITAGAPKEINYWDFKVSVGANYRTGNTEQTEASAEARVRRRTVKSRITIDYLGNYNSTNDEAVADNHRVSADWDLFLSKRFFVTPVFAEWYRDPFQNLAGKYTLAVAAGYDLIDTPKIDWEVSAGPGYIYTEFDDVEVGEPTDDSSGAFVIGTTYDHDITKRIDFLFEYRGTFTNETSGEYLHHLLTSLEFELTTILDFDITWVWDRIEQPRAGSDGTFPEQDDFRLSFMLGLDF